MLETLLVLVVIGAIAGFTARSLVPGPDPSARSAPSAWAFSAPLSAATCCAR